MRRRNAAREAQPTVHTVVSAKSVAANGSVSDTVTVTGLWGAQVTVPAALYGPFPARNAIACSGTPVWTGAIQVTADGTYQTEPHALATPGYYTYYETIAAGEFVRAVKTPCADVAETTIVPGQPAVKTQISAQQTKPGGTITDKVVVTGIGKLALPVQVALYGPFPTRGAIACSGPPYWHGSFVARGDGTYTTAAVRIEKAGYYTYREAIVAEASPDGDDVRRYGRDDLRDAQPAVTTITSNDVRLWRGDLRPRPGQGLATAAKLGRAVRPVRDPSGDRCTTRLHGSTVVTARGDGVENAVPPGEDGLLHLPRAADRFAARLRVHHPCAVVAETSLVRPEIVTGRGDVARYAVRAGESAPTRVRLASPGDHAPVSLPGSTSRTVRSRFRLDPPHGLEGRRRARREVGVDPHTATSTARRGRRRVLPSQGGKGRARVTVTTAAGRTFTYRVVPSATTLRDLPTSVYC
jgi:hypothetical protein